MFPSNYDAQMKSNRDSEKVDIGLSLGFDSLCSCDYARLRCIFRNSHLSPSGKIFWIGCILPPSSLFHLYFIPVVMWSFQIENGNQIACLKIIRNLCLEKSTGFNQGVRVRVCELHETFRQGIGWFNLVFRGSWTILFTADWCLEK